MHPPQDDQREEKEGHDNGAHNNILTQEIDSWSYFEYVLREENRLVSNKMLSECKENEDFSHAASSKDEFFSAESLFVVLILQQQQNFLFPRIKG
jgi:hypothetical protein